MTFLPFSVFFLLLFTKEYQCVEFSFHSTEARGDNQKVSRSSSSTGTVVKIDLNGFLAFDFCLREKTKVNIKNVYFSNDGKNDEAFLYLDGFLIATFVSHSLSLYGAMWNVFENATINKGLDLPRGWHVMKLVLTSGDALEIDRITVDFSDQRITKDVLDCSLVCLAKHPTVSKDHQVYVPQSAVVSQTSYPTECAEEDNVKVPIVLKGIIEYSIRACMPGYRTFENRRGENITGCTFLPHVYWKFSFQLPSKVNLYQSQSAMLTFLAGDSIPKFDQTAQVKFQLRGRGEGHIDADIGSVLTLKTRPINTPLTVIVTVFGRAKAKVELPAMVFLPGQRARNITIPDFTWSEKKPNMITLSFRTANRQQIYVNELMLERRPMKPEKTRTVFKNGRMVVDLVYMDFWWRAPEAMKITIKPSDGQTRPVDYDGVAYFRISRPVPWSKGNFAQIFVMYQDGNVRLLQLPPSGLDWIPFGTSVIIGATNHLDHRPSAPIKKVEIDPSRFIMYVSYVDGSSAEINLISTIDETTIIVSRLKFKQDMSVHPFATIRSMYVADGNSDCDSVLIDGDESYHIMDKWRPKSGKSFMFFRRCESKHLTLSPDILVKILRTQHGRLYSWWKPLINNWQNIPEKPSYQYHKYV